MKKQHLPEKICPVCQRPFQWRKKWERNWEEVKYCSERCRRNKSPQLAQASPKPYLCQVPQAKSGIVK